MRKKKPARKPARQPAARPRKVATGKRRTDVDIVAELKAIGADTQADINARIRALRAAGQLEVQMQQAAGKAKKPGKKEQAAEEAETAGKGTSWGNDLEFEAVEPAKGKSLN